MSKKIVRMINSRLGQFMSLLAVINLLIGALLALIYRQMEPQNVSEAALLHQTMWTLFFTLLIVSGVLAWLFLLAHESRVVAQKESNRQTRKLTKEIDAHQETDRALQEAKELAERSNAAKSRYLTGISHELRTPLQSIIGYAQLLSEKEETPRQHQHGLDIIQRSGEYLADLIEGLLDISKIEAGRLDLNRNTIDLPGLIDQLNNMFSMQATSKGLQFQTHIHDALPKAVTADEKRIRQILINLLSNAVKYTAKGKVTFHVRYRNQVAEFLVQDTGPGIEDEHLKRIFDPFERVRNSDTANLPGTGLGLTIVKLLTEIMGGDLQAHSKLNQGSEFKVSLLLPWLHEDKINTAQPQHIEGYEGEHKRLFIVDDDPIVRGLLADLLSPLSFTVYEARDGHEALSQLEHCHADLFLLDVSMPGMSGLELAKELRKRGIIAPIVMLSADAQEQHRQDDEKAAFDTYLVKPVNNATLLNTLAEQLSLTWQYKSPAQPSLIAPSETVTSPPPTDTPSRNEVLIPDSETIRELVAFAQMGYRKGIANCLQLLSMQDDLPDSVLQKLNGFYQAFQFDQLANYLIDNAQPISNQGDTSHDDD